MSKKPDENQNSNSNSNNNNNNNGDNFQNEKSLPKQLHNLPPEFKQLFMVNDPNNMVNKVLFSDGYWGRVTKMKVQMESMISTMHEVSKMIGMVMATPTKDLVKQIPSILEAAKISVSSSTKAMNAEGKKLLELIVRIEQFDKEQEEKARLEKYAQDEIRRQAAINFFSNEDDSGDGGGDSDSTDNKGGDKYGWS